MNDVTANKESAQNLTTSEEEQHMLRINDEMKKAQVVINSAEEVTRGKLGKCFPRVKQRLTSSFKVTAGDETNHGMTNEGATNEVLRKDNKMGKRYNMSVTALPNSEGQAVLENTKETTTSKETENDDPLTVSAFRKLVMPLMPGYENDWVMITRGLTETMPQVSAAKILNAIRPQLKDHPSAWAQAEVLLVEAAGKENMNPLQEFYKWIEVTHRIPERQRLRKFTSLLKNMSWSWQDNPADQLQTMLGQVQLSWGEVAQETAFSDD